MLNLLIIYFLRTINITAALLKKCVIKKLNRHYAKKNKYLKKTIDSF